MAIDWGQVATAAENAVIGVLGGDWTTVSGTAKAQLGALVQVGLNMELEVQATPPTLTADEYASNQAALQNALAGILQSYEAIGIVAAQQAAAAAWNVVAQALKTAYRLPFIA